MSAVETRVRIDFAGRRARRRRRAAVVVLEGASRFELRRAIGEAERFDREPLLIAVDGGLSTCRAIRRKPDLFVGDLDSARAAPPGVTSRIYPIEKDFSDFAGALREARRLEADVAVISGLLGGRLDHEWANLLEMGSAAAEFSGLLAPSDRGLVAVTARSLRAATAGRRFVSLFALGRAARVTLRGTWWVLERKRIAPGSLGLSNVTADALTLDVHEGVAALVFPAPTA